MARVWSVSKNMSGRKVGGTARGVPLPDTVAGGAAQVTPRSVSGGGWFSGLPCLPCDLPPGVRPEMRETPGPSSLVGSWKVKKEAASAHSHHPLRCDWKVWAGPAPPKVMATPNPFPIQDLPASKCFLHILIILSSQQHQGVAKELSFVSILQTSKLSLRMMGKTYS